MRTLTLPAGFDAIEFRSTFTDFPYPVKVTDTEIQVLDEACTNEEWQTLVDAVSAYDPNAQTGLELYEQAVIDAESGVVILRPDQQYEVFLTMTREEFSTWYAANGPEDALWIVILVLRYLIACKNRAKVWLGQLSPD